MKTGPKKAPQALLTCPHPRSAKSGQSLSHQWVADTTRFSPSPLHAHTPMLSQRSEGQIGRLLVQVSINKL